ncbi:6-phosphofructokinase, partial [Rhodococcus sp. A5(2022)]|uniref:6-phosphofructokinase n=1 Tax=Rhodococcus sp. A5(2022) TaxID=3003588 RepID=UPI003FA6C54A
PGPARRLAILCAGGPAPGLNSVIAAATIRANLLGVPMLGIQDGFRYIMDGEIHRVQELKIEDVSRIHFRGGSHIGISRANLNRDAKTLDTDEPFFMYVAPHDGHAPHPVFTE